MVYKNIEDSRKHQRIYYQLHKKEAKIYSKEHYKKNIEYLRNLRKERRNKILNYYGNKCNCCGETESLFLTIDHINNDGYKERNRYGGQSDNIYRNIIKNNYPNTYQILCMNCNFGKFRNNGICPHKTN